MESDALSSEEINNSGLLMSYADLTNGNLDSSAIGEVEKGSDLNLNFSLKADWVRRIINGDSLVWVRTGYSSDEAMVAEADSLFGKIDSQPVFTLELPEGVDVKENPTANVTGLDGFTSSVEVKSNTTSNIKTVVVSLRLDNRGKIVNKSLPTNV